MKNLHIKNKCLQYNTVCFSCKKAQYSYQIPLLSLTLCTFYNSAKHCELLEVCSIEKLDFFPSEFFINLIHVWCNFKIWLCLYIFLKLEWKYFNNCFYAYWFCIMQSTPITSFIFNFVSKTYLQVVNVSLIKNNSDCKCHYR